MKEEYILASKENLAWHFNYLDKYLRLKYNVINSIHSSGNKDHKANPKSQFLFGDITEELKVELREFGMDILFRDHKVKLK